MGHLCVNCNQPIELVPYALGPKWLHVNSDASFPTERKGTAWWHCRLTVAAPVPSSDAWLEHAIDDQLQRPDGAS